MFRGNRKPTGLVISKLTPATSWSVDWMMRETRQKDQCEGCCQNYARNYQGLMYKADTAGQYLPASSVSGCGHVECKQKRQAQRPDLPIKPPKYLFIASFLLAGGEEADFRGPLEAQRSLHQPESLHGCMGYDQHT